MGIRPITRRLTAAVALAALAAAPAAAAVLPNPGPGVRVRKEINSLTPLQIEAFRAGVARMQARPASDPTSWLYQANIHGYPLSSGICPVTPGGPLPAWGTCTHGTFFFLPWHRMYLYFFERILRKAVREAVGDPNYEFSLPYWDYQLHPDLPAPLRVPAQASNALYVQQRSVVCNAGLPCVPPPISSSAVALGLPEFCDCPMGAASCIGCERYPHSFLAFGSRQAGQGNGHGQLEFQPHDLVHVVVGGVQRGWMGYVECAARDPAFYLHHGNIDRLWQVWLNLGLGLHANPLENDDWKNREFVFFDENGQQVTMTGCDVLDTAAQLDYAYDGVPVQNVVRCEDVGGAGADGGFGAAAAFEEPEILGTSEPVAVELGNTPVTVTVPLSEEANQRILAVAGPDPGRVLLDIADIEVLNAGAVYGVYLEVPAGQTPDPQGPHFAGNLGIFVDLRHQHPQARGYDITEEVQALYERSRWSAPLSVTFVRATGQELGDPDRFLRIGRISVSVH